MKAAFAKALALTFACAAYAPESLGQELVKKMVAGHRQSVVHLRISRTTNTGEVVTSLATGFIVTSRGHVLTNCHAVDKVIRDDQGNVTHKIVDSVTVRGATASKEAPDEALTFLDCASNSIDLALLKFGNSAVRRVPVTVMVQQPTVGDELGAMGFPLSTEFFARRGVLASEAEDDTLLVDMLLNPGDSGAPVFDNGIRVIGVAQGSRGGGIGVIRPVRHAAQLLAIAGVNVFAVNAPMNQALQPVASANGSTNVFLAPNPHELDKVFRQAVSNTAVPLSLPEINVTYPVASRLTTTVPYAPAGDVRMISAKPGYKITDVKFIVTNASGAEVIHAGVSPDGTSARAAFEARSPDLMGRETPFVQGYLTTKQVKLP